MRVQIASDLHHEPAGADICDVAAASFADGDAEPEKVIHVQWEPLA